MGLPEFPVISLPDDAIVLDDDCSDHRVGAHPSLSLPGKAQGAPHVEFILQTEFLLFVLRFP